MHEFVGGMHLPEKILNYPFVEKKIPEQTGLLNYKEFKTISYKELSTCDLLFNLLMNIPGLQILDSCHSC